MTTHDIGYHLGAIKPNEKYASFLRNKKVAIVGPSKHILLQKNGSKIDDYDVVIRLKWLPVKGHNQFKDYIGDKTDVIYSSTMNNNKDFDFLAHNGVAHWCHPNNTAKNIEIYSKTLNFGSNTIQIHNYSGNPASIMLEEYSSKTDRSFYKLKIENVSNQVTRKIIGVWPQVGFQAILDAIASGCNELYITGITSYHGGGHMLQKNKPAHHNKPIVDKHDGVLETLVLLDLIDHTEQEQSTKIILDPVLQLITSEYRDFCSGLDKNFIGMRFSEKTDEITLKVENLVKDL